MGLKAKSRRGRGRRGGEHFLASDPGLKLCFIFLNKTKTLLQLWEIPRKTTENIVSEGNYGH